MESVTVNVALSTLLTGKPLMILTHELLINTHINNREEICFPAFKYTLTVKMGNITVFRPYGDRFGSP